MNKNNLDLEILKSHLKPFEKNGKFELDSKIKNYHEISLKLCQFLEDIILRDKEKYDIYDKIFIHLLDSDEIDLASGLRYYSNFYLQRRIEKILKKTIIKKNTKEKYFKREFLNLIKINNSISINREKIINTDNIFKPNILYDSHIVNFLNSASIQKILSKIIIADPVNEKFFTEIRKIILKDTIKNNKINNNHIIESFCSRLSSNCFFNEYSWFESDEETSDLDLLEKRIRSNFKKNKKLSVNEIFILASYRPLITFKDMKKYFMRINHQIIKDQLLDYELEEKLSKEIKTLSPIKNQISINVQNQYEEYPYPKWNLNKKKRNKIKYYDYIDRVTSNKIIPKNIKKILVAGCGTGRHPINIAINDPSVDIVAVDLSKKSLSYAYRKSKELKLKNIRWIHGDILDLISLNEKFDVVESVGVLHHMEDPKKGFNILSKILKSKGFLYLGLYSKNFRSTLKKAKNIIAEKNYSKNLKSIQKARRVISKHTDNHIKYSVIGSSDFYSTSSFIDLLMHEQELDFEINDIVNLYKKDFNFLGFSIPKLKKNQFNKALKKISTTDDEIENWKKIERVDNSLFSNMYQFWLQKK